MTKNLKRKSKAQKFQDLAHSYHQEKLEIKLGGIRAMIADDGNLKIYDGSQLITFTLPEAENLAVWIRDVYKGVDE